MPTTFFGNSAVSDNDFRFKLLMDLEANGWEVVAAKKHDTATHPGHEETLVVPRKICDKHFANRLRKQAGIEARP